MVDVRLYAEHLDVYYAQRHLDRIPRMRGKGGHRVHYGHIIDWLVRKPGAFANYRYRDNLFPTSRFRMAYDALCAQHALPRAYKEYLQILHLAAQQGEARVDNVLGDLLEGNGAISACRVGMLVQAAYDAKLDLRIPTVSVPPVDLKVYDCLLTSREVAA
jgi:hypothetical protein